MNQKEKLRALVKSMIAEAVSHRIAQIDEAGDIAANEAKMARIQQEADKAGKVKGLMEKINLSHYLGEKLYAKVMEEMDKSITEYEGARLELEEKMSGGKDADKKGKKKSAKSDKKDEKPEEKDEVLETEELSENALQPGQTVTWKDGAGQEYKGTIESQEGGDYIKVKVTSVPSGGAHKVGDIITKQEDDVTVI